MPKFQRKPVSAKPGHSGVVSRLKLSALTADRRNANKGTDRGRKALDASLRDLGAGRSVLIDAKGRIIAGNKTINAALKSDAMDQDIIVVKTDGRQIVAVQRTDLDLEKDPKAKALAIADNRVSELDLAWDKDVLAQMARESNLSPFFTEKELRKMGVGLADGDGGGVAPEMPVVFSIIVDCKGEKAQNDLLTRLEKEGYSCRLLIS